MVHQLLVVIVIEKTVMKGFHSARDSDKIDIVQLHLPSAQNLSKQEQMVAKTEMQS
jgi:hypothetical protein